MEGEKGRRRGAVGVGAAAQDEGGQAGEAANPVWKVGVVGERVGRGGGGAQLESSPSPSHPPSAANRPPHRPPGKGASNRSALSVSRARLVAAARPAGSVCRPPPPSLPSAGQDTTTSSNPGHAPTRVATAASTAGVVGPGGRVSTNSRAARPRGAAQARSSPPAPAPGGSWRRSADRRVYRSPARAGEGGGRALGALSGAPSSRTAPAARHPAPKALLNPPSTRTRRLESEVKGPAHAGHGPASLARREARQGRTKDITGEHIDGGPMRGGGGGGGVGGGGRAGRTWRGGGRPVCRSTASPGRPFGGRRGGRGHRRVAPPVAWHGGHAARGGLPPPPVLAPGRTQCWPSTSRTACGTPGPPSHNSTCSGYRRLPGSLPRPPHRANPGLRRQRRRRVARPRPHRTPGTRPAPPATPWRKRGGRRGCTWEGGRELRGVWVGWVGSGGRLGEWAAQPNAPPAPNNTLRPSRQGQQLLAVH